MAATKFWLSNVIVYFALYSLHFYYYHFELHRPVATVKSIPCLAGFAKTKRASLKSSKHGLTTLAIPGFDPPSY